MEKKEQPSNLNECKKGDFICFDESNEDKKCPYSPCAYNLEDFGTHQRIIETYLRQEKWDVSFYYFRNLMNKFPLNCSLEQLEPILAKRRENPDVAIDKKALPVGCLLYVEVAELTTLKNDGLYFYESREHKKISEIGLKKYKSNKLEFSNKLLENLVRLDHLVKSKKEEMREIRELREYNVTLVKAQMGTLKAESVQLPPNIDVENALTEGTKKKDKKKDKIKSDSAI